MNFFYFQNSNIRSTSTLFIWASLDRLLSRDGGETSKFDGELKFIKQQPLQKKYIDFVESNKEGRQDAQTIFDKIYRNNRQLFIKSIKLLKCNYHIFCNDCHNQAEANSNKQSIYFLASTGNALNLCKSVPT